MTTQTKLWTSIGLTLTLHCEMRISRATAARC